MDDIIADSLKYVISAENLKKVYRLDRRPIDHLREAFGLGRPESQRQHRAIDGISLAIRKGETVGILGVNGAGKSTLLQMITGTLAPTSGRVTTVGRIAALLELGAGFNPMWSGRKNAEFQCVLQGVTAAELPMRIAAIQEFADIGDYFDQPARTYSSGMFLRVAFAAAVATDPDILIVDEALAVGDVRFQNKCFRRFEDMQAKGCTVLFVTHSPDLVTRFCSRCVVLQAGRIAFDGATTDGVRAYLHLLYPSEQSADTAIKTDELIDHDQLALSDSEHVNLDQPLETYSLYNSQEIRSGNKNGNIISAELRRTDGSPITSTVRSGEHIRLLVTMETNNTIIRPDVGFVIRSRDNLALFGSSSLQRKETGRPLKPGVKFTVEWRFSVPLFNGEYFIDLGFAEGESGVQIPLDWRMAAIHFTVESPLTTFGVIYTPVELTGLPLVS